MYPSVILWPKKIGYLAYLSPRDAVSFAKKIREAATNRGRQGSTEPLVSVDCSAVKSRDSETSHMDLRGYWNQVYRCR